MKKILAILLVLVSTAAFAQKKGELLQFNEQSYDFGVVTQTGGPVVHEYEFTNVADQPVAVLSASADCGCATPEYPVKPLMPGEKGVIKITYNPKQEEGDVVKEVKVRYRAAKGSKSQRTTLRLTGIVTQN